MAKKLNKVFLNPTAEQIEEYQLIEGISWFTDMDTLADALEADQKKKAPERIYSLNNFQIVDGARELTANLTKIAKQTGFTLSNDLSKVIDWAKTEIDYDVEYVTDHRVASTAADGEAELSDFQKEAQTPAKIYRKDPDDPAKYPATAKGEEDYQKAIADQLKAYDDAPAAADTKVIGYKDLTLTNVGSKATAVEEGETYKDRVTTVTQYTPVDVKAGDFTFDYQYDSDITVDKQDSFLVTEAGKASAQIAGAASGSLSVKDSVINNVTTSFSESSAEIKGLQNRDDVNDLVAKLEAGAGAYETVTIDNSTVLGKIQGGAVSYVKTATSKNETFLDKPEESGSYYNAVSAETNRGITDNNAPLYIAADGTSSLTEAQVKELQDKQHMTVVKAGEQLNTEVNKYEIVTYDIDGNPLKSGTFVYLTGTEFGNLSGASKKALNNGKGVEVNVGWVDYDPARVVTDANFQTFTTAPSGAAAANTDENKVNKYVWEKSGVKHPYYLTAGEETGINTYLVSEGYALVPTECVTDGSFRRIAEAGSVNKDNMDALAKDAYNTVSTNYQKYTVSLSMDADKALELNKEAIPAGFAWVKQAGGDKDSKALFRMSQFTKSTGGVSVETQYYLTASEMVAMGFFSDAAIDTYAEVVAADADKLTLDGWAFTDNATGNDRVFWADDDKKKNMYRDGDAATAETLAKYTTDKTDVVTAAEQDIYKRHELSYTTNKGALNRLDLVVTDAGQLKGLVDNSLVGETGEFVTVIDGQTVNMYQLYGYGATVTDPTVTVTAEKLTLNEAEIEYDGVVQKALWDGDKEIKKQSATLVDGVKTQNTKKFFDPYFDDDGEYVAATPAEQAAGEKKHTFITVAEKRTRGNNETIGAGYVVTDRQATIKDGDKYVAAYLDRNGKLTKDDKSAANLDVKYYKGTDGEIYALMGTEAGKANAAGILDYAGAQVFYYTSVTGGGAWFDTDVNATAWKADAVKATVQPPTKRDFAVPEIATIGTIGDIAGVKYTDLTAKNQLTNDANWTYQKAFVTEKYNTVKDAGDDYDARVQIDGKEAYIESVSGTLVTDAKTTYEAIYKWELQSSGTSVDGLSYFMTEAEKAKVKFASGVYPTNTEFVKIGTNPVKDKETDTNSQYRISKLGEGGEGLDKSAYLSYNTKDNKQGDGAETAVTKVVDNAAAYYKIDYVLGYQVYKYTISGDSSTYYLTEKEVSDKIGSSWGTLTKGDAVEGAFHYGFAADYGTTFKPNFTKAGTVYYFTDSYSGDCITQDAEGNAVQAFNADGAIWSNINGQTWDGGKETYSNYESELCENTYFYTYEGDREGTNAWTTAQVEQIAAAETAAGIATWTVQDIDGQIVWTRTSSIGEVSVYTMDHEDVDTELNAKDNYVKAATGSISVINGSEVRGAITGYLDVTVADSTVADVIGGNQVKTTTETLSTSKGKAGKDGNATITTKETKKTDEIASGAGSFTISRADSDKVYKDAGNVSGYETVSVTGVDTGALTVANTQTTTDRNWQTTYQGDPDALRSDYREDWAKLAFSNGIVSKITADNEKKKTVSSSDGSVEVTGRDYKFVPGADHTVNTANKVIGDISGYKQVALNNVNLSGGMTAVNQYVFQNGTGEEVTYYLTAAEKGGAVGNDIMVTRGYGTVASETAGYFRFAPDVTVADYQTEASEAATSQDHNIVATDTTSDSQTTYKLATKGNVDTATETKKTKDETKALAELTASNTVTNPEYEADLTIGNITGFKTVTAVNYSFGDANAMGDVTKTTSKSSVRDAVASDMRLINAGVNAGAVDPKTGSQKYAYGTTDRVTASSYANTDMNFSSDVATKRTANGTLTASGRAYTVVNDNYTENAAKSQAPVYRYTQAATSRVVYLTEEEFKGIQSGSKTDANEWTKDEKTAVYYRNSTSADHHAASVKGTQVVYLCSDGTYLTKGEFDSYNLVAKIKSSAALTNDTTKVSLRVNSAAKATFGVASLSNAYNLAGTVAGVYNYVNDKAEHQFLTEAEAAALGGWTKDTVDTAEYVRKASAADDDRTSSSVIAKADMTASLQVYKNDYDSSLVYVLTEDEAKVLLDTTKELDGYSFAGNTGYRKTTGADIGLSADSSTAGTTEGYNTTIFKAHSYVKLNEFNEIVAQVYVTEDEYTALHAAGKDLADYVVDDGSYVSTILYNKALTRYQYRTAGWKFDPSKPLSDITTNTKAAVTADELYRWELTDDEAAAADVYAAGKKSEFVLEAITEDPKPGNTTFGNIYGYKDVVLTGMNGGNIIRVAKGVSVAADNETEKKTYKKTIAKAKGKGKTTYTENDSKKTAETWTAAGTVTLVDSQVGNIAGYKTVDVASDKGSVEVGQISRTTQIQSLDKKSYDETNKVISEDTAATFKQTWTEQTKTTENATAAGSVSLIGKRAGEALVLDKSVVYETEKEAEDAAKAAIKDYDNKQFADVAIKANGGVVGYQDVVVENATIKGAGVVFDGGKYTLTKSTNQTTVTITDNTTTPVAAMNKINDSTNTAYTATGSLTLTNVNYAGGYTAKGKAVTTAGEYTTVSEYVFNGVTYALTNDEKAALLEYGDLKQKATTPVVEYYDNVLRKDDTITTRAVELQEGKSLDDVVNAKGVKKADYAQDTVYFAAKAKNGAGTEVDLYISATKVNDLLAGKITDLDDGSKKYTEAKLVDGTTEFYGNGAGDVRKKADFETTYQVKADVKKYVVTEDDKATTYYLTKAEADVMTAAGKDVKAGSDTKDYTRMTSVTAGALKAPVTVDESKIDTKPGTTFAEVYEYRGVEKDTGISTSYYLKDATEVATLLSDPKYASFGKVSDEKHLRDIADAATLADAKEAHVCYEVLEYNGTAGTFYLTASEVELMKALDSKYADLATTGPTKYYRTAKSPFEILDKDNLDARFTSVNESAVVKEITTKETTPKVLGYLTAAEILALRQDDPTTFDKYYGIGTQYYRAADDTTDIVTINPFKAGDGYVIAEGADLSKKLYYAEAVEALNIKTDAAAASGFKTVTLTNAGLGNLIGGNRTDKTTEKLAAKKNSTIATYTETHDESNTAVGSLTAVDSFIGSAQWYDKVILIASEMDNAKYFAGDIEGGKVTKNTKTVSVSKLYGNKASYGIGNAIEYTMTTKENKTATGSAVLENVVAGDITRYKDVTISFDKAIVAKEEVKNQVGSLAGIIGGNITCNDTVTSADIDFWSSYTEGTDKETGKSVGTVDLTNVYVNGDVKNFVTANITDSQITGDLTGGDWTNVTTQVNWYSSIATEWTITATGKAIVTASKIDDGIGGGDIAQFKDVELIGGVEVGGDIIVGGTDTETVARSNKVRENTACYAVFFKDSEDGNKKKTVYLTEAEFDVFVKKETSAMIDTVVSVYREEAAMTDDELKAVTAVGTMKGFKAYTDDAVTDMGAGKEGKDTETWTVKAWGNALTIDDKGAKVGGKVEGYASVTVSGDSSFGKGYFGTSKADKLTVEEKTSLATFTTIDPKTGNPIGFDFGEGKDELVLDGTIGIQAAFKYDTATGTNAWNLETVSGSGTIVCRTEDVKDVKAAFEDVKVFGSDNYDAVTALEYQSFDDAKGMNGAGTLDEWLGFCDGADYFKNDLGVETTLSLSGAGVTSGDVIAQVTIDGGAHYTTLKDGDKIVDGAVVRISQSTGSKNAVSNDYTIAFK